MDYLVKTNSIGGLTEEQFFNFCQENEMLNMERNANGEIIIMSPTGNLTSWYNLQIGSALFLWNKSQAKPGIILDSNGGVTLPNGAVRSADAAYISKEKWDLVSPGDKKKFAHVCPDFVIELLSETDSLKALHAKMEEYIENGCRLAWLINPKQKETIIYRENGTRETIYFDHALSGEQVMPGFTITLSEIFTDD